ncbi:MAG: energy transducer TonB [Steroidobacteraceae bacterium]
MTASPRIRGDGTAEPAPAAQPSYVARRLVVLTCDPALASALQEVDGEVSVVVVDALARLTDELMQQSAASALLDIAALDAPVDAVVDALAAQFPDLRLMVAGQAADQSLLASRISEQVVFRFVHKPASPQRLKLFIDAAARSTPLLDRRTSVPAAAVARPLAPRRDAAGPPRSTALPFTLLGVMALAAAATAGWYFWSRPAAAPAPVAAPSAPPSDAAVAGAAQLEQALRDAETALLAGQLDAAAAATEQARLLDPQNPRLAFLAAQIERERTRGITDAAQREAQETRQMQVRGALISMEQRVNRGALLEPLGDSAVTYYRNAESIAPQAPSVLGARDTLVAALLNDADRSLGGGNPEAARRLVDVAAQINANAPGLDLVRRRIDEVIARAAAAAAAPPPVIEPARLAAAPPEPAPAPIPAPQAVVAEALPPAQVQAPAAAPAGDAIVSATRLTLLRRAEARYPQQAFDSLTNGWVELEFTVATDGGVKDIVVTASEPGRTFDGAAITALRRYRYAPVLRNGVAVEQRARLRMRFTAQDSK